MNINSSNLKVFLIIVISIIALSYKTALSQNNTSPLWEAIYKNNIQNQQQEFKEAFKSNGKAKIDALLINYLEAVKIGNAELTLQILEDLINSPELIKPQFEPYFIVLLNYEFMTNGQRDNESDFRAIKLYNKILNLNFSNDIKIRVYEVLHSKYKYYYKIDKSENIAQKIAAIEDWQALGSFENISASGFDKDFGVVTHPEKEFEFKDKNNAKVKWFNCKKPFPGNWIYLNNSFYINNNINYVQSFCNNTKEQIVQFRVGTSGSLKAWINDQLVIKEEEERNNGTDTYICTIKLNVGYNRILLQLGSSEIERQNFRARITDNLGNTLPDLTYSNNFHTYQKETNFKFENIECPFEKVLYENIKSSPDDMINYLILGNLLVINGKHQEANLILKNALKLHPKCGIFADQLINSYSSGKKKTALSLLIEEQKEANPNSYSVIQFKISEAINKEDYDLAKKLLDTLESFYGSLSYVYRTKAQLLAKQNKNEKLYEAIEEGYKIFPQNIYYLNMKFLILKEQGKVSEAEKLLLDYLKIFNSDDARNILANHYLNIRENKKYFKQVQILIEQDPCDIASYYKIADQYTDMHDYENAVINYKQAIEIAPYVSIYYQSLAFCYLELGKTELAKKTFERALELDPFDFTTREELRKINGKKPIFENFKEPDMYSLFKNSPNASDYPNDNILIITNSINKVVYKGGASEEKNFILVKAFTKKGIDQIKEINLPSFGDQNLLIEKAEVLKKDGSKLKAEVDGSHIVFTNLAEGDAISLIYKNSSEQFGTISQFISDKKSFSLFAPYLSQKYSLLIPKGMDINYKFLNGTLEPSKEIIEDMELLTWEKTNQKGLSPEPNMPSLSDFGELLVIGSIPNWEYVCKWYMDLSSTKTKSDLETKEVISEILPNLNGLTKLEIVKKIYNYIVENIRYSSVSFRQSGIIPQKASDVISSKIGDCKDVSTLFVALCKEVGIDANLVLVSTRNYGKNSLPLPSIDFNHCIATTTIDNKKYYVELTTDLNPFGTICFDLKDATILEIKKDQSEIINLNPIDRKQNNIYRKSLVTFKEGETLIHKVETIKTGGCGAITRSSFRNLSKDEQWKEMNSYIADNYAKTKLTKLEFAADLMNTSDSIKYNYEYEVPDFSIKIMDLSAFKLPITDGQKPMEALSNEDRKFPFDLYKFSITDKEFEEVDVIIPNDKTLVEIPKNISLSNEFVTYKIEFTYSNNKLNIKRDFAIKNDIVLPINFPEFKKSMESIIKSDVRQIAFKEKK